MPRTATATTSELTVTGTCEFAPLEGRGEALEAAFEAEGEDPDVTYFLKISDSSGRTITEGSARGNVGTGFAPAKAGETYTLEVREGSSSGELVATGSVTCPELTELFSNQGTCIEAVQDGSVTGITKQQCKTAFKGR
jgi:hypothetical protein